MLSGNRNFEGRIHPDVRMNYLASPPLVVAYALAGTMDIDLNADPIGHDAERHAPSTCATSGRPTPRSPRSSSRCSTATCSPSATARSSRATSAGGRCRRPSGEVYAWDTESTYIRRPPFLDDATGADRPITDVEGARVLALLGDSVTTDHISPAGNIRATTPAGQWLIEHGVEPRDFNSYGARRGNHEVMVRGTFANVRLRNQLAPGTEGGFTLHQPDGAPHDDLRGVGAVRAMKVFRSS